MRGEKWGKLPPHLAPGSSPIISCSKISREKRFSSPKVTPSSLCRAVTRRDEGFQGWEEGLSGVIRARGQGIAGEGWLG